MTHAPFHASVLRPASQVGPMHENIHLIASALFLRGVRLSIAVLAAASAVPATRAKTSRGVWPASASQRSPVVEKDHVEILNDVDDDSWLQGPVAMWLVQCIRYEKNVKKIVESERKGCCTGWLRLLLLLQLRSANDMSHAERRRPRPVSVVCLSLKAPLWHRNPSYLLVDCCWLLLKLPCRCAVCLLSCPVETKADTSTDDRHPSGGGHRYVVEVLRIVSIALESNVNPRPLSGGYGSTGRRSVSDCVRCCAG